MASEKCINLGSISLGTKGWGSIAHAPALSHTSLQSTFNVSALQTSSEASAAAATEKYGALWPGVKGYRGGDYTGIAEEPGVDVVVVSVNAPHHKAAMDMAVAVGKDPFVEYPVGKNLEESEDILRQVKAANGKIRVMVGLQGRQSATMRKVKAIIDSGKIGKILSTTSIASLPRDVQFWQPETAEGREYLTDKNNGATLLRILGGHQLDNLIYLLGPFASVSGTASMLFPTVTVFNKTNKIVKTYPSNTNDHYTFAGPLVSGAFASITWRSGFKGSQGRIHMLWIIDGEEGSIKFESEAAGQTQGAMTSMRDPKTTVNGQPLDDYLKAEGIEYSDPELVLEEGEKELYVEFVRRSWIEFAKTLRGGKGEFVGLEEGLEVLRLVDAVERSAAQGGLSIKLH